MIKKAFCSLKNHTSNCNYRIPGGIQSIVCPTFFNTFLMLVSDVIEAQLLWIFGTITLGTFYDKCFSHFKVSTFNRMQTKWVEVVMV